MSYLSWHYIESNTLKFNENYYFITKSTSIFTRKTALNQNKTNEKKR
jgi:hypothetical protein